MTIGMGDELFIKFMHVLVFLGVTMREGTVVDNVVRDMSHQSVEFRRNIYGKYGGKEDAEGKNRFCQTSISASVSGVGGLFMNAKRTCNSHAHSSNLSQSGFMFETPSCVHQMKRTD